jgi:hypothetical protein
MRLGQLSAGNGPMHCNKRFTHIEGDGLDAVALKALGFFCRQGGAP